MLNVSGMVVIPSEPRLKVTETNNGAFINFEVVSIDDKKNKHRYNASVFVKSDELNDWQSKIEPGNVFMINYAQWAMKDNPDFKYPIPQLYLNKYNFRKLVTPFWIEVENE